MGRSPSLVLGPIVRYTDQTSFSVWVQLDMAATLVGRAVAVGPRRSKPVDSRVTTTAGVDGRHYAIVHFERLAPATLYRYALHVAPGVSAGRRTPLAVRRARGAVELPLSALTYGEAPSVRTFPAWKPARRGRPAADEPLRATFGSCRKFEGGFVGDKGPDILELYGVDLEVRAVDGRRVSEWPHLLFLTGDQIYADDVSDRAQERMQARRKGDRHLPTLYTVSRAMAEREAEATDLSVEGRVSPYAGVGEFHCVDYADYADLYEMAWSPADVRSLFARVPVFMVPDDHDVTDDFMITGPWIKQTLADPQWRLTLISAMTAYWVYQGWGNLSRTAADAHLIAGQLARAGGRDVTSAIRLSVIRALERAIHAPLYFTIPTEPPIIAIDARTDRQFVAPAPDPLFTGSTTVLVGAHRDDRILSDTQFAWLKAQLARHDRPVLVTSVPVFTTPMEDYLAGNYTRFEEPIPGVTIREQAVADAYETKVREKDADTWFSFPRSVNALLQLLSSRALTTIVSGDIHYSFGAFFDKVSYIDSLSLDREAMQRKRKVVSSSQLLHVVSSAIQNEWNPDQAEGLDGLVSDPRKGYWLRESYVPERMSSWKADRVDRVLRRYGTRNNVCEVILSPGRPLRVRWLGAPASPDLPMDQLALLEAPP